MVTICESWGYDPKDWFPKGHGPNAYGLNNLSPDFEDALATLSKNSGRAGRATAPNLTKSISERKMMTGQNRYVSLEDLQNAIADYTALAMEKTKEAKADTGAIQTTSEDTTPTTSAPIMNLAYRGTRRARSESDTSIEPTPQRRRHLGQSDVKVNANPILTSQLNMLNVNHLTNYHTNPASTATSAHAVPT